MLPNQSHLFLKQLSNSFLPIQQYPIYSIITRFTEYTFGIFIYGTHKTTNFIEADGHFY